MVYQSELAGYDRQQLIAFLRAERAEVSRELQFTKRHAAETAATLLRLRKRLSEIEDGLSLLE
jgi:hypothetical protein